jgi:negative regulator of flagellin synthesis FlgM
MKVIGQNPYINLEAYAKNIKGRGRTGTEQGKETTAAERIAGKRTEESVVLSPEAKEIHAARQKLEDLPDVRQEKVNEIKKQLMNGSYSISDDKVASKMVEDALLNEIL